MRAGEETCISSGALPVSSVQDFLAPADIYWKCKHAEDIPHLSIRQETTSATFEQQKILDFCSFRNRSQVNPLQVVNEEYECGGKIKVNGRYYFKKHIPEDAFKGDEVICQAELHNTGIIAKLHEVFVLSRGEAILVMEFLKGKTLNCILEDPIYFGDDLDLVAPFALSFLQRGLEVIFILHGIGWSHNDLHGDNIMLLKMPGDDEFVLKLIDFEMANKEGFDDDVSDLFKLFESIYNPYLGKISSVHKALLLRVEKACRKLLPENISQLVDQKLIELHQQDGSFKTRLCECLFRDQSNDESADGEIEISQPNLSDMHRGNENRGFNIGTTSNIDSSSEDIS